MHDPKSAFSLTCPSLDSRDARVAAIRARGNLPLMVDGQVLAEIDRAELAESWVAAAALKPSELAAMTRLAGERLAQTLKNEIASTDLIDIVSDAAVLFLLTMRRYGANGPYGIMPCTVIWDEAHASERIVMRA
jgi:hypothetical protein